MLNAKYALANNAHLNISIDPKQVTQASISYGTAGIFGQKTVSYWIDHGKLVSRFTAAGKIGAPAQMINASHDPDVNIDTNTIHITPTAKQVKIAGYLGRIYHISARIGGNVNTWDAVLATGADMFRLDKAWNQVIGELGPIQSSDKIAATLLVINLHPKLYGHVPLKIGSSFELMQMHHDISVARIYTPDTINSNLEG